METKEREKERKDIDSEGREVSWDTLWGFDLQASWERSGEIHTLGSGLVWSRWFGFACRRGW